MRIEKGFDPIVADCQQFQDFKESVMQIYFAKKSLHWTSFYFPDVSLLSYFVRLLFYELENEEYTFLFWLGSNNYKS